MSSTPTTPPAQIHLSAKPSPLVHRVFGEPCFHTESDVAAMSFAADGSGLANISRNPAFDGWPMWSPDGRRIAFASNRSSSYQVYVMDADGSDVRLVANTDGRATAPQWSRDGKGIYFPLCRNVDYGYDCEIYAARLDGKDD